MSTPGATSSGFIRPSRVGPELEKRPSDEFSDNGSYAPTVIEKLPLHKVPVVNFPSLCSLENLGRWSSRSSRAFPTVVSFADSKFVLSLALPILLRDRRSPDEQLVRRFVHFDGTWDQDKSLNELWVPFQLEQPN